MPYRKTWIQSYPKGNLIFDVVLKSGSILTVTRLYDTADESAIGLPFRAFVNVYVYVSAFSHSLLLFLLIYIRGIERVRVPTGMPNAKPC